MNKFGQNLTWFLNEAACSVDDLKEDGMIPSDIDIYGGTPEGADTSCNVDIKDLLAEAAKRINELEQTITDLRDKVDDVIYYGKRNPSSAPQCVLNLIDALTNSDE